jgi:predicted HicB family RNase H-like nuclease
MKPTTRTIAREVERHMRMPYCWTVIPQEEGGYTAGILEFQGCVAEGESSAEALKHLNSAARAWLRACLETGERIPPPLTNYEASGRFALRLPRSVHARAVKAAALDGVSLNQFVTAAVSERLTSSNLAREVGTLRADLDQLRATLQPLAGQASNSQLDGRQVRMLEEASTGGMPSLIH